jgi:hypothetical protein
VTDIEQLAQIVHDCAHHLAQTTHEMFTTIHLQFLIRVNVPISTSFLTKLKQLPSLKQQEIIAEYHQAAKANNPSALMLLAMIYHNGIHGMVKPERALASDYFLQVANEDSANAPGALYYLGNMLLYGAKEYP